MIQGYGSPIATKGPIAIAALVAHGSRARAAREAGVDRATLARWLRDEPFAAQLATAQREHAEETMQVLRSAMLGSVELLVALRDNPSTSDVLRRQCAYDILVLGKNALESADLAERLGKLESALEEARRDLAY